MTRPLRILPEAEEDLATAAQWYEDRQEGLRHEFLDAFHLALEALCEFPEAQSLVDGIEDEHPARQTSVRRFSYRVVFHDLPDEIRVLAVAHVS